MDSRSFKKKTQRAENPDGVEKRNNLGIVVLARQLYDLEQVT